MAEKMGAKERIPEAIVKGGERYLWIARLMPSGAVFLAVAVEAIGGAFLEFFAKNEHMPDPLFRRICQLIAERDEKRHQELCSATYNELYRTGSRWENLRNRVALRELLRAAYGDKTEDHHLIQACRAFGLESDALYRFVAGNLSKQLETIGMHVPWDSLLEFLPKPVPRG
jgi:ribonucleotide reductase beta subunit family protein with ferritin-like domain